MDRFTVDASLIDTLRTQIQAIAVYANKSEPLPGTALKLDDQVMWLDLFAVHVLWGYEMPDYFHGYCADLDPDGYTYWDGIYVTDRAPADSQETPMPIYPQQAQQRQNPHKKHDPKRALQELLKRLPPEAAKRAREIAKHKRPELLEGETHG